MCQAQINRVAIDQNVFVLGSDLAQGKNIGRVVFEIEFIGSSNDVNVQAIKRGTEFAPQLCLVAQINVGFNGSASVRPIVEILTTRQNFNRFGSGAGFHI